MSRVTIHDKFCLINIIFSEELGEMALHSEDTATRTELDAGVIGHNSQFWKLVESHFNSGFPSDGVDGQKYPDIIHHIHPLFDQHDEVINPGMHGTFKAEKLRSLWKEMQSEYDTVMTKFTKSGNHQSSFMRAAMKALNNDQTSLLSSSSLNDDDEEEDDDLGDDDESGVEAGGWCCFTNSLPIIYLRMWLNERPLLTTFVSRKIPDGIQLDTMKAEAKKRSASDRDSTKSDGKKQKKSPSESIADAFISFVKIKEEEAATHPQNIMDSLGGELKSVLRSQAVKEKIDLLEKQIAVVTRCIEQSQSPAQKVCYTIVLCKLESELNDLVII